MPPTPTPTAHNIRITILAQRSVSLCALLAITLLCSLIAAGAPIAHADDPILNIIIPKPVKTMAAGPVGASLTIKAEHLSSSSQYTLGFARADLGCANNYQPVQADAQPLTPQDDIIQTTFQWPAAAAAVGNLYVVCLKDTATTSQIIQSAQTYFVGAGAAPSISVAAASGATNNATFIEGQQVIVTGANFYTNTSTPLVAFLASSATLAPDQFNQYKQNALKTAEGAQQFKSQADGSFTVTLTLPPTANLPNGIGTYNIFVISNDGTGSEPPSLQANQQIAIQPQPSPTPTPTATPQPTSTPTSHSGGSGSNPPGQVFVFGGLSIALFIVGIVFFTLAAGQPRSPRIGG